MPALVEKVNWTQRNAEKTKMHYISDNNEWLYLFPYSHCLHFEVGDLLVSVKEAKWMHICLLQLVTKTRTRKTNHDTVEALVFHQRFFQCHPDLWQVDGILEPKGAHDVAVHTRLDKQPATRCNRLFWLCLSTKIGGRVCAVIRCCHT
jgi:hypothetical protein